MRHWVSAMRAFFGGGAARQRRFGVNVLDIAPDAGRGAQHRALIEREHRDGAVRAHRTEARPEMLTGAQIDLDARAVESLFSEKHPYALR